MYFQLKNLSFVNLRFFLNGHLNKQAVTAVVPIISIVENINFVPSKYKGIE